MRRPLSFKNKRGTFKIGLSIKTGQVSDFQKPGLSCQSVCGLSGGPFFRSAWARMKPARLFIERGTLQSALPPAALYSRRRWFIPPWTPRCCQRTQRRHCSAAMHRAVPALRSGYRRILHPSVPCGTPAASPSDRQSRRKVPADTA